MIDVETFMVASIVVRAEIKEKRKLSLPLEG